jgi:sulfur relay (sulfurtransferase) complex TusBCD TusD component (DsrE family)
MHTPQHGLQQANQARQIAQQLMQQTQQGTQQYRMMLQQEQQNVQVLEQMLQREKQAVQVLEQSIQNHNIAINRCQEVMNICTQMERELAGQMSSIGMQTSMRQPVFAQNQFQ